MPIVTTQDFLPRYSTVIPASGGSMDGWNDVTDTWTYSSTDDPTGIITVNADVTDEIGLHDRIKFVNGGNTIYGIVSVAPTVSSGTTTIKFLHEIDPSDNLALVLMANSAITLPKYSHVKNPFGFPSKSESWSLMKVDTGTRTQASPTAGVWYNLGTTNCQLAIPIGRWKLAYKVSYFANRTSTIVDAYVTLSTANNSESDKELTSYIFTAGANASMYAGGTSYAEKSVALTTKEIRYLNALVTYASVGSVNFDGANARTSIKAVFEGL